MPIRGYTQMHRTATGTETNGEPSGQGANVPYCWVATQPVHHSAFWPPNSGLSSQPEQDYFTAQLQIELAKQQGNRSSDLYHGTPAFSALSSGLSSMERSRISSMDLQPPQIMAGAHEVSFPQAHLGDHASTGPQDLQSANWMNSVGVTDNAGFQYLQAPNLYASSQTPQASNQALNLERQQRELALLQSELSRVQNDLGRAEREIARQKSLRETERSEFSEAKERLKHSWANDREDFARVKTSLKTKNAEHHTQSGRLSQHLKDSEACNRALRELIARNGIPIPLELEVNQVKRLAGHNCLPKTMGPSTDPSWTSQTSLPQMIPKESGENTPPRSSLDSYLQHLQQVKRMQEHKFASKSLPEIFGSHLTLNTEDRKTEGSDIEPQDKQHQ